MGVVLVLWLVNMFLRLVLLYLKIENCSFRNVVCRCVLCVVTVEKSLINITDRTNLKSLSFNRIIQPSLLFFFWSVNSLRTVIGAFHESRNFIFRVKKLPSLLFIMCCVESSLHPNNLYFKFKLALVIFPSSKSRSRK